MRRHYSKHPQIKGDSRGKMRKLQKEEIPEGLTVCGAISHLSLEVIAQGTIQLLPYLSVISSS